MKKTIFCGGLAILVVILSLLTSYYQDTQADLVLESNNLYSKNNDVYQLNIVQEEKNNSQLKKRIYRLFYEVPNNLSLDIRAVYTNNYQVWALPLQKGDFFSANDTKQAIVGKNVPLKNEQDKKFFLLNQQKYEVIGYLGKYSQNLFNYTVLLSDNNYFTDTTQQYTLDVKKGGLDDLGLKKKAASKTNKGVNRLLTVDFFSPLILLFSKIVSLGTLLLLAYYFNWSTQEEALVLKIIGYSKGSILLKNCIHLGSIFFIASVLGYLANVGLTLQTNTLNYFIDSSLYLFFLIICYFIIHYTLSREGA